MPAKFFGQYLIDHDLISGFDLDRVLKFQGKNNLPFGALVIQMDLMTPEQVKAVQEAQKFRDLPFGDMAIKMGFLTLRDVNLVLKVQQKKHVPVGQALIALGVLSEEELARHLDAFGKQLKSPTAENIRIPAGIPYHPILRFIVDMSCKMLVRLTTVPFRLGPGSSYYDWADAPPIVIGVELTGTLDLKLLFAISAKTRDLLSRSLLDNAAKAREGTAPDIIVTDFFDAVAVNIVNKALGAGYDLETSRSHLCSGEIRTALTRRDPDLFFPIFLADGDAIHIMIQSRSPAISGATA